MFVRISRTNLDTTITANLDYLLPGAQLVFVGRYQAGIVDCLVDAVISEVHGYDDRLLGKYCEVEVYADALKVTVLHSRDKIEEILFTPPSLEIETKRTD